MNSESDSAKVDGGVSAVLPAGGSRISAAPPVADAVHHTRRRWTWIIALSVVCVFALASIPWVIHALHTVSTDDAYVNGHVTFVAARVAGQVTRVLVEDNNRVHKGDVLVELDKEPFQDQVNIARSAVSAAEADLAAAESDARGTEAQVRSLRFALERSIEDVDNQAALLRSKVAVLDSQKAVLDRVEADFGRVVPLIKSGAITQEEFEHRKQAEVVAKAQYEEALQGVYQIRVALGLAPRPAGGEPLTQVPEDLDQTFSGVRQAQASLMQAAAKLGYFSSFTKTPKQMVAEFYQRDPEGNIDRIYAELLKNVPAVKQAQTKLLQVQSNLAVSLLNLSYCDVKAEIDGVVTRREVNPGNNVLAGQSLMALRSLTDIWVDANFKETQLGDLRIGQSAELDIDMYGSRRRFRGRVSGFTMGTGSTLALLPAENATGNFVKVVQRLPVRIELLDYDPDKDPLFIGLSVKPLVNIVDAPTGPDAGKMLQPYLATGTASSGGEWRGDPGKPQLAPAVAPSSTTAPIAPESRR